MTFTGLTSGIDQTGAGPYTTASIAPTSGALVVVCVIVGGMGGQADGAVTVAGLSGTWTRAVHLDPAAGAFNDYPARAFTCSDWSGSGALTITATGGSAFAGYWAAIEVTGTGTPSLVVASTGEASAATSVTVTMAAFGDAANVPLLMAAQVAESTGTIPGTGFTEIHDMLAFFSGGRLHTAYGAANDNTADANTGATDGDWMAIALEIADGGGGGGAAGPLIGGKLVGRSVLLGRLVA